MVNSAELRRETPALPVPLGEVIAGKYRLERILGSSGMGIVYGGTHIGIDQPVAVKFLLVKGGADEDSLVRFTREAKFMAKINSEHVVRVLDVGSLPDTTPFIVMEHLNGDDLSRTLHKRGPLPIETAVDYLLQACEGLATAHAAGVIHRDLKPSNLFLTKLPDGRELVKLIDFGVAKYRGTDTNPQADSLTQTHVMIGSPRYMAPEQVRASKDVDARSDVWSLAVILQELLTGRPVFKGPTVSDTFVIILTEEPPRADAVRPDVPPQLADLILRALVKDATYRTPSVASFASELLAFVSPTRRMRFEAVFSGAEIPPPPRSFSFGDTTGPHRLGSSGSFAHLPPAPASSTDALADAETRTAGGSLIGAKKPRSLLVPIGVGVLGAMLVVGLITGGLALQRRGAREASAAVPSGAPSSAPASSGVTDTAGAALPTASPPSTGAPISATASLAKSAPSAAAVASAPAVADGKARPGRPVVGATKPPAAPAASAAAAPATPPPAATGSLFDDPK